MSGLLRYARKDAKRLSAYRTEQLSADRIGIVEPSILMASLPRTLCVMARRNDEAI